MARILTTLVLAAAIAGVSAVAFAQQPRCGERSQIVRLLSDIYNEQQHGLGLVGNHALIELFLAPSGSWTILSTGRNGVSCIVASGHAWEDIPPVPGQAVNLKPV